MGVSSTLRMLSCTETREEIDHWVYALHDELFGTQAGMRSRTVALRLSLEARIHRKTCTDCNDYLQEQAETSENSG